MNKKSITIDRQYGSGGRAIGKMLSTELEMPFYDEEILPLAAEKFGLNPGVLREYDEKRTDSLLYNIAMMTTGLQGDNKVTKPYEIFEAECSTIKKLANQEPSIFSGRCANFALENFCDTLHVFIYYML